MPDTMWDHVSIADSMAMRALGCGRMITFLKSLPYSDELANAFKPLKDKLTDSGFRHHLLEALSDPDIFRKLVDLAKNDVSGFSRLVTKIANNPGVDVANLVGSASRPTSFASTVDQDDTTPVTATMSFDTAAKGVQIAKAGASHADTPSAETRFEDPEDEFGRAAYGPNWIPKADRTVADVNGNKVVLPPAMIWRPWDRPQMA